MDRNCLFCKIIQNEVPAHKIYEDKSTLSFLDIKPLAIGHALVIPKVHKSLVQELSSEEASELFRVTVYLSKKIHNETRTKSSTIGLNNGVDSGQEVPHIHIHIIPRSRRDGGSPIHSLIPNNPNTSQEELQELASRILHA